MTKVMTNECAARLRAFISEIAPGQCKIFSLGQHCPCPLCDLDKLANALTDATQTQAELSGLTPGGSCRVVKRIVSAERRAEEGKDQSAATPTSEEVQNMASALRGMDEQEQLNAGAAFEVADINTLIGHEAADLVERLAAELAKAPPREPTQAMIDVAVELTEHAWSSWADVWRAMYDAARAASIEERG